MEKGTNSLAETGGHHSPFGDYDAKAANFTVFTWALSMASELGPPSWVRVILWDP